MDGAPFELFNADADSPVLLSVPHGGRAYGAVSAALAVPVAGLTALEDRHADRLADGAIAAGMTAIVARAPRLLIDLNRAPADLDPGMIAQAPTKGVMLTGKARAGLGLIPRHLPDVGEIWRRPLPMAEVDRRLTAIHAPFHAAIADRIAAKRARHGGVVLLDIHSMPSLKGKDAARIVIGDRFGASAAGWLRDMAQAVLSGAGLRVGVNMPYAGGHILDRHGRPRANFHALQVEFDRRLYLDATMTHPGPGLAAMTVLVAHLAATLGEALGGGSAALAAE